MQLFKIYLDYTCATLVDDRFTRKKNDSEFKVFFLEHRSQNKNGVEKTDSKDNPEQDETSDPTFRCHDSDKAEKAQKTTVFFPNLENHP